jgi:EpsI family protein
MAAERALAGAAERAAERAEARRTAFAEFPGRVGRWRGEKSELNARQLELLRVDDYLRAEFYPDGAAWNLSVYVGYYRNADRATQHPPDICYPGGGWTIAEERNAELAAGAAKLRVRETVFRRPGESQLVVYWYRSPGYEGADTSWQKVARLKRILTGKAPAGAAKIQIAMPVAGTTQEAHEELESFLAEFLPELEEFLPSDEKGK